MGKITEYEEWAIRLGIYTWVGGCEQLSREGVRERWNPEKTKER